MDLHDKKSDEQTYKNKSFIASLEFALQGFRTAFKEERNLKAHVCLAIVAIIAGFIFRLALNEWLWLLLVIFLVIVMEIINTTAENIVDMVTNYHFNSIGKKVKDMAAAAVLLTACFAMVVGALIFVPKVWAMLSNFL